MSSTLFEAPPFDPVRERRKHVFVSCLVIVCAVVGLFAYLYRFWPEERVVARFFDALQHNDFEKSYGIWQHDRNWKQHPRQYANYPYPEFYKDWGPKGGWGIINSYHVDTAATSQNSSGVVVQVTINNRTRKCYLWVEKESKTLSFSPFELQKMEFGHEELLESASACTP